MNMRPITVISSLSNHQIKNINQLLKKSKARDEQGIFIVEGQKMFEEARAEGLLVRAFFSESFYQRKLEDSPGYFSNLEYEILTDSVFQSVSETKTPQGVMGTVKKPQYSIDTLIRDKGAALLLLEDVRDPGNLGTMVRTAEGAGITGIILNSSCVDLFNPKVIRSTMGSIYRVPFAIAEDFNSVMNEIKKQGIRIFAAHLSGQLYDTEESFQDKCAILIGNEANGLSDEVSAMADSLIKIPMAGKVESLNAAIAAAILMYEVSRQRR